MDGENRTPLLVATSYGWADIAETLLAAGALIDQTCEDGWTSLTTGIFWNMHGSVRLLLDKGAGTLVVTDQGETLLHVAVKYGDIKMLEMLAGRDLGALDLDAKTGAGETVYAIAKARDESSDWQKAFHALLESIRDRKSDSKPQADKIADGLMGLGLESSETLVDLKTAGETVVTNYAESDSGSELDHFEDALETVA
jgi:hypothetical protein